ncbi:MAG: DUF3795 domain-containing protein [Rikenellaceae bacterium]|nr:DUF3795 domain-containing protein [Rikenellaceae bacterium]
MKCKPYSGRVPACGVFCGGCPVYTRDRKPCLGAEVNRARCERCKSYHLCCLNRGVIHCFQCNIFPCARFRSFARSWLKYGQDLIANQLRLKADGIEAFLVHYNTEGKE